MQRAVDLPVGPQPDWELEEEDEVSEELPRRSVADSLVILQSLKQSRTKWLSSTFPKFSSKARGGKAAEVTPAPHSIKAHGRFDLTVGPHTFHNTAFYEVHYIPQPRGLAPPVYGASQQTTSSYPAEISITPGSASQLASSAGVLSDITYVTPALISQLNAASSSNPTLSNLLHLAAAGRASPEQLDTLRVLMQSLGAMHQPTNVAAVPAAPPSASQPGPLTSTKDFDIVMEFQERSFERWILPRGPVVCERVDSAGPLRTFDALVSMPVPFSRSMPYNASGALPDMQTGLQPRVLTFRLLSLSEGLWTLLQTWAGGVEGKKTSQNILADLKKKAPKRTYLQHHISDDALHSQIRAALAPPYTMKSIVPGNADGAKPKRKTTIRKSTKSTDLPSVVGEKAPVTKRRQFLKQKTPTTPLLIACRACGQTDVPLMMGGRYCRSCIDAGKAVDDIPQVTTSIGRTSQLSTGAANSTGPSTGGPSRTNASQDKPILVLGPAVPPLASQSHLA